MRILAVDQYGELGGAQRCLADTIHGFADRGWEVGLAAPAGPLLNLVAPACRSTTEIECGPFASGRKTIADLRRFASQWTNLTGTLRALAGRADLVFVNGPRVLPASVRAANGLPIVFHAHSLVAQPLAARLTRWAIRLGDVFVIATSHYVAGHFPCRASLVVHNGVSPPREISGRAGRIRNVAGVGRVAQEKGQLEFVRAAHLLRSGLPEVVFTLRGTSLFGKDRYARQVAATARAAGVAIAEWENDPAALYRSIDLLVVPSEPIENTPRVILEAFAAGIPVIAYACGGITELIEDGRTGVLVRERTPEALAAAIRQAVGHPWRMEEMAARALSAWRADFTVERFQRDICEAVVEAARRRNRIPEAKSGAMARA